MGSRLFDPAIVSTAEQAVAFIGNIIESSTEYSIIGKDLDGNILLWNKDARRARKGWHRYLDFQFDRGVATTTARSITYF